MRLLISLLTILLPLSASAQPPEGQDWWACQSVESAGLIWKDQRWNPSSFTYDERFILIAEGDGLQKESVAKAMGVSASRLQCFAPYGVTNCLSTIAAESFTFNPGSGEGAIGKIIGGAIHDRKKEYRDSLAVTPFECTKG